MKVLVNGIGNIGTTLLNLLVKYKYDLGISEIYANKNKPQPWQVNDLILLKSNGVRLCSPQEIEGFESYSQIAPTINYIFDCGSNGSGNNNKSFYNSLPSLIGACAQGSEKNFGTSFMSNINDKKIYGEKFVHVVSCNTHGTAALLNTFAGENLNNLIEADVVVVRRSEDLGNHQRLVAANVVARHLDPTIGTHHAIDVCDLYETLNIPCKLTSSDVTTPSQLMHTVRFNVKLKDQISLNEIKKLIAVNPYLSVTNKFDSNVVFELGRRYGFQGRIYSHAIVVYENLLVDENSLKGWAFVPQEGNSILSTIHAFLLQTKSTNEKNAMAKLNSDLLFSQW